MMPLAWRDSPEASLGTENARSREPASLQLMAEVCSGQRAAQRALLEAIDGRAQRTLYRLLGRDAPLEPLLEAVLMRAIARASEYDGDEPLTLWADRAVVQVAMSYLSSARPIEPRPAVTEASASVRELLSRVQSLLRRVRPEEHVAFALLELDGRPLLEVAVLVLAAPMVVRQRAERARRQLLFAARRDRTLVAYLRLSERLRELAANVPHRSGGSQRASGRLHENVLDALHPGTR
jgi:DNA-directed RNA polymerase specialized sigma24 family protein